MFLLLQQMAVVSLQQQTQQHTLFFYHRLVFRTKVSLGLLLLEVLQRYWNEDNGNMGNIYMALSHGSYFVVSM
jgi:hypothetical protein